jgi:tetratricopeptide (TPR) repeat protein
MGKTALATWAVLRAYDSKTYDYIVSVTAKDRELTSIGLLGIENALSTFDDLLDSIAEVLGFPDLKSKEANEKEADVRLLLSSARGLLFVDNLETVDDARIIEFLDSLPLGTKAITTSRRTRVRVAVNPVDVGPMSDREVVKYIEALLKLPSFRHVESLRYAEMERIAEAWERVPLAIRWALSRCTSSAEAIGMAERVLQLGSHGDELLEFSFRRVFEMLNEPERAVMETLATLQSPLPLEAIVAGSGASPTEIVDALDDLAQDSLVQRLFDQDRNDYCFTVTPLTRSFVLRQLSQTQQRSAQIQRSLSSWFDAMEVSDPDQRVVVRELRRGGQVDESSLVDLAVGAEKRGDYDHAEELFLQALSRNPRSWKAARLAGEFYRRSRPNVVKALQYYRSAAANAPSRGSDRALILREYGLLARDSGEPSAHSDAEEALIGCLAETPNDEIALASLARLYDRRGAYGLVIALLEPHSFQSDSRFGKTAGPLLLRAYDKTVEIGKAASLRRRLSDS